MYDEKDGVYDKVNVGVLDPYSEDIPMSKFKDGVYSIELSHEKLETDASGKYKLKSPLKVYLNNVEQKERGREDVEGCDPNSNIRKILGSVSFTISDIYGESPMVKLTDDNISPYIEVDVTNLTKTIADYTGLPTAKLSTLNATEYGLDINEYGKDEAKGGHKEWTGDDIDTKIGIVNLTIEPSSSFVDDSDIPESVTIRFSLRTCVSNVALVYVSPSGSARHVFGGYYTTSSEIYKVIEIKDYNGNPVGESGYGFLYYISNLDKVWDLRGTDKDGKYIGTMNKDVLPHYKGAYVVGLQNTNGTCNL